MILFFNENNIFNSNFVAKTFLPINDDPYWTRQFTLTLCYKRSRIVFRKKILVQRKRMPIFACF